jgi:hypothetical protein
MKKSRPKLALRKETLRALSSLNLAHAVGGQETDAELAADITVGKVCPAAAIVIAPRG